MKVYTQLNPPVHVDEDCSTQDLPVLDTVSITKITDFMTKFQADATFSPPTNEVVFDNDDTDVTIDDDIDSLYMDIEDMDEDIQRAREKSK